MSKIRLLSSSAVIIGLIFSSAVFAIGNFNAQNMKPGDLKLLPPYCTPKAYPYGDDRNHPQVRRWLGVFDYSDWRALHHYCLALHHLNRANREFEDTNKKQFYLRQVLGEINYMEAHVSPTFILNPEMAVKKGETLERLGQSHEALVEYQKSLRLKSDYISAYFRLSDLHRKQGNLEEAKKIILEGLKHKPNSKGLKRRLRELEKQAID